MEKFDVIVVGSGLGGGSAAAHLAAAGRRVLLVERYSTLGGSSHVFRRRGSWEFDCGVHYIGDCGDGRPLPTLFRGLGLEDRIEFLPLDPDGFDTIVAPGMELRVPSGWDGYADAFAAAFPRDARGIRRVVSVLRALGGAVDRVHTPGTWSASAAALRRAGPAAAWAFAPYLSLLVANRLSPEAVLAMSVHSGVFGSTPDRLAVMGQALFLENFVGGGAYYPRGGGQVFSAAFAEVVLARGGRIRLDADVERILVEGGRVVGVALRDGERIGAPVVVSDADVVRTFTDLVGLEHLSPRWRRTVRRWRMGHPLITGFFGVGLDLRRAPNTNHFVIPSWDDAASLRSLARFGRSVIDGHGFRDGRDWARAMAARQPMFVQSSTRRDPAHRASAPAGHGAVEVQTIAPYSPHLWGFDPADVDGYRYRAERHYGEVKEIVLEGMVDRMERAYPGAASGVRLAELGTPATQQRFVGNTGGAPFGLEMSPGQVGPLRPDVRGPVRGLFLAGTSTRWGPGTEGSMTSGRAAASAVLGRDLATEVAHGAVLTGAPLPARPGDVDVLRASRASGLPAS